jgi:hypothetical protein
MVFFNLENRPVYALEDVFQMDGCRIISSVITPLVGVFLKAGLISG